MHTPILLPFATLFALFLAGLFTQALADRPNVVIFLADDLGYSDLSSYRALLSDVPEYASTAETPNLDRLAEEGILFTQFYSGAAVCSPSRGALLTGRNATRLGIYNWIPGNGAMYLRNEEVTLAEVLKQENYLTGHFGKWHLTPGSKPYGLPMYQGFDYAFYTYNNAEPSHHNPVNFHRNGVEVGPLQGYASHLVVDEALQWLDSMEGANVPFYLNIWFNEPHERVAAPQALKERHRRHQAYYGCIENMDLAIGRVLNYLNEHDLRDNTLIIFSSDNGSQVRGSNVPLRGAKAFNFEGGIRVPFIASWPGHLPEGAIAEQAGHFPDVLPTLVNLLGLDWVSEKTLDGEDLSQVLQAPEQTMTRRKPIYFFRYFHEPICMLREDQWVLLGYDEPLAYQERYDTQGEAKLKPEPGAPSWSMWGFQPVHMEFLLETQPRTFELYDIEADPAQKTDLAEEYPERVAAMKATMLRLRREMVAEGGHWYAE